MNISTTSGPTAEGQCESPPYVSFEAVVAIETGNCLVTVIFLHCDEHGSKSGGKKQVKGVMWM